MIYFYTKFRSLLFLVFGQARFSDIFQLVHGNCEIPNASSFTEITFHFWLPFDDLSARFVDPMSASQMN